MDSELTALSSVSRCLADTRHDISLGTSPLSLVVAVSGGEDSHVLLHVLWRLIEAQSLKLEVAHFDHALRPESNREAEFVADLADRYGLPFHTERAVTPRANNENIEAWARRERYRFLEAVRVKSSSRLVVTAHHRDDQVETVLFRLLTGRFPQGALGIARYDQGRAVLRPLLEVPKSSVSEYGIQNMLEFVSDPSNDDTARTRNRLRHDLLPLLQETYNPQIDSALLLYAERYRKDEEFLLQEATRFLQHLGAEPSLVDFKNVPEALLLRVLAVLAHQQIGESADFLGMRDLLDVVKLVRDQRSELRRLDLGGQIRCAVDRYGVRFTVGEVAEIRTLATLPPEELSIPGFVERRYADGREVTIRAGIVVVKDDENRQDKMREWLTKRGAERETLASAVEYFDLEKLQVNSLQIRERRDGDRLRVWHRGERKLKKLLLEKGVRLAQRDCLPVVESADGILWVPGVARSELAPVSEQSRYILELRYNQLPEKDSEMYPGKDSEK